MFSEKELQDNFLKMRNGSKAAWNFSENSSVLVAPKSLIIWKVATVNCEVWQNQDLPFWGENCWDLGFLFFFRICCFAAGFPGTQSRGRWTEN